MNLHLIFDEVLDRPMRAEIQACGPQQARLNHQLAWARTIDALMKAIPTGGAWQMFSEHANAASFRYRDASRSRVIFSCALQPDGIWLFSLHYIEARQPGERVRYAALDARVDSNGLLLLDMEFMPDFITPQEKLSSLWHLILATCRVSWLGAAI
jgi:hypothetical protein